MRTTTIVGYALWAVAGASFISLGLFHDLLAVIPGALWLMMTVYGFSSLGYKYVLASTSPLAPWLGKLLRLGLFAPLITRLRPEDLENKNRQEIQQYVTENPGASIQEVREAVGVAWGTAVYHLDRLRKTGQLVSHKQGNHHRYWAAGTPEARLRRGWAALEHDTTRDIAMAVASAPGVHQGAICEHLDLRAPSASKHLSKLEKSGLVEKTRISRYTVYQPTDRLHEILRLRDGVSVGTVGAEATAVDPTASSPDRSNVTGL